MTGNQIAYWSLQENIRHNKTTEVETSRSNRAKEAETQRSNVAKETETNRANLANESLKKQQLENDILELRQEYMLARDKLEQEAILKKLELAQEKLLAYENLRAKADDRVVKVLDIASKAFYPIAQFITK